MRTKARLWLHGLIGGVVGGIAGALDSGLALVVLAPDKFNLDAGLHKLLLGIAVFAVLSGVKVGAAYLKQSPLPSPDDEPSTPTKVVGLMLAFGLLGWMLVAAGCGSTPEERIQSAADIVEICAYNATDAVLIEKPGAESRLRAVADEFRELSSRDKLTLKELTWVISQLPLDKLKSPYARLLIRNGVLVIEYLGRVLKIDEYDVKPIAVAVYTGIERRIGPRQTDDETT